MGECKFGTPAVLYIYYTYQYFFLFNAHRDIKKYSNYSTAIHFQFTFCEFILQFVFIL